MVSLREVWGLLKETFAEWQFNQVSLLASSLAYYTVFSLAPLMIIVIMIAGAVFGEAAAEGQIVAQLQELMGEEGAQVIATAIANLREDTTGGPFRLIFNIGFLLLGASGVFAQIQNALDKIWEVKPEPGLQVLHFLRKRLLSFAMVLVIVFLLVVSFVANTTLAVLVSYLNNILPGLGYLWQILSFLVSFGVITVLFASIYTILPDAKVAWRDTGVGAIFTTVLFMVGQFLFGLFLSRTDFASAYGVAGSFLIIITWIYYAAHILFLGAEFTKVYAKRRGSPIVPEEYAVPISQDPQTSSEAEQTKRSRSGKNQSNRRNHRRKNHSGGFLANLRRCGTRLFQRLTGR